MGSPRLNRPEYESLVGYSRIENYLTLKELGKAAETHPSKITSLQSGLLSPVYLRGKRAGEIKPWVKRVCDVLKVSPIELFPRYLCDMRRSQLTDDQILDISTGQHSLSTDIEDIFEVKEINSEVSYALSRLTKRQMKVIKLYFGFNSEPMTFREIGEIIGLTHERVRQIMYTAIRILRYPRNDKRVREWIPPKLKKKPKRFMAMIIESAIFFIGYPQHRDTVSRLLDCLKIYSKFPCPATEDGRIKQTIMEIDEKKGKDMVLCSEYLSNHRTRDGLLVKYNPYQERSKFGMSALLDSSDSITGQLIFQ